MEGPTSGGQGDPGDNAHAMLQELYSFLAKEQRSVYWQAAALVVVVYDHLLLLDLEIELIWMKKASYVQVLYFLNRYSALALFLHGTAYHVWLKGDAFVEACKTGRRVQMWLSMIGLWSMQGIIINRIWCMYSRSKTVIILLCSAFAAQIAASMVVVGMDQSTDSPTTFHPKFVACIPTGLIPHFWLFLCFIIAFDALIFVLAIKEGLKYFSGLRTYRSYPRERRQHSLAGRIAQSWSSGGLLHVLFRDSIIFPFIGLAAYILALLAWLEVLPHPSTRIMMIFTALTSPILGSRLILNLRDAYYRPFADEFTPATTESAVWQVPHSPNQGLQLHPINLSICFAPPPGNNQTVVSGE